MKAHPTASAKVHESVMALQRAMLVLLQIPASEVSNHCFHNKKIRTNALANI
jgi:hypothetical protein